MSQRVCVICNKNFEAHTGTQKCCSPECSKINIKKYELTPKRIAWIKRYNKSQKIKNKNTKWRKSKKGKEWLLKYTESGKRKKYHTLYHQTEKYKTSEHSEKRLLQKKIYQEQDKYKLYKKEYLKRWNLLPTTPLVNRRKRMKRRAAKNNIIENFTPEQFLMKAEQCKGICPNCHKPFNNTDRSNWLTIDHVYPVKKANEDFKATGVKKVYTINDVQPLCFSCNSGKRDKI